MPRARQGSGSIDRRPNGTYRVRLYFSDGKQKTLGHYATEEIAKETRDAALRQMAEANISPVGGMTLRAWGTQWLDKRELLGKSDSRTDRGRWARHVETSFFIDWPIKTIEPVHVHDWAMKLFRKSAAHVYPGERKREKLSVQTLRNIVYLLRACLRDAQKRGIIPDNPVRDVEFPEADPDEEDAWTYLTLEEQSRLLAALPDLDRCVVAFAIGTGLREGEQRALLLDDLFLDGEVPYVHVRHGKPGGRTKTKTSRRRVPLFGLALDAIRRWLEHLPDYCLENPKRVVFPTTLGTFRAQGALVERRSKSGTYVYREYWGKWLADAGIDRPVRWHDLRHTCASSLVSGWWGRQWTLQEVKEMLGHASIKTTERYAHLGEDALKAAARATVGLGFESKRESKVSGDDLKSHLFSRGAISGIRTQDLRFTKTERSVAVSTSYVSRGLGLDLAERLLRAASSGHPESAELAGELAALVLSDPLVDLAQKVSAGGPHILAWAVSLAETILREGAAERGATQAR